MPALEARLVTMYIYVENSFHFSKYIAILPAT